MFGIIATLLLLNSQAFGQDQRIEESHQIAETDVCVEPPANHVFLSPAVYRYAIQNLFSQVRSVQVIPKNDRKNFHVLLELQPFTRLSDPLFPFSSNPQLQLMQRLGLRTYGNSADKENSFLENLVRNHIDAGRGIFLWDLGATVNGNLVIDVKDAQDRKVGSVKIGASFDVDKIAVNAFGYPGVSTPTISRPRITSGPPSISLLGASVEFSADRFSVGAKFKMIRLALDDGEKPLGGLFNCSLSYKIPQGMQFGLDLPTYVAKNSASSAPLVFILPTARMVIPLRMSAFQKNLIQQKRIRSQRVGFE